MKTHSTIRYRTDARREARRHWRDEAVTQALQLKSYGNGPVEVLLAAIRRNLPGCATISKSLNRPELMRFLIEKTDALQSLLPSEHRTSGQYLKSETDDYLSWHSARWDNETFEIVICPDDDGDTVHFVAPKMDDLARLLGAVVAHMTRPLGRTLRYDGTWKDAPDLASELSKVSWDDVVLSPKMLASVRGAVESFFHCRSAFDRMGFPWKRGVLLIGPPGTGKTMICKAAANGLPDLRFLYVRDLRSQYGVDAIRAIFEGARSLSPCILAFEDLDGLIGQHNRTVFLNELDGFQSNEGLLIIASSNHPGKIDEALLKRPSRFDQVFHIGLPAAPERREYARRLLSRSSLADHIAPSLDIETLAELVAECSEGFTPAYLKEAFLSAALLRAQEGADALDDAFGNAVLSQCDELRRHLKSMRNPEALAELQTMDTPIGLRRNGN